MEKVIDYYLCFPTKYHGHYMFFEKKDAQMILQARYGCFISRIIDSGKKQMEWNDITIHFNKEVDCKIYVCISDQYDELANVFTLTKNKQRQYIKHRANIISRHNHTLLYDNFTIGQYLICMVEIFTKQKQDILIEEIHFTYPKINFVEYLPAIYHNQLFLQQFLAIFQSLYLDIEKENEQFINQLDISTADSTMVYTLAKWLGINSTPFMIEDLRRYMAIYNTLYLLKGTKEYFEVLVEVYCGKRGYVIEYDNEEYIYVNNQIGRDIYNVDTNSFILLIFSDYEVDRAYVEQMILKEVPITITCKIVWLDKERCLDNYCFIGYNSYLTNCQVDTLQGNSYFDKARMV